MTRPLAMTLAIPKYKVGNGYCLIRYFKTMTVYSHFQSALPALNVRSRSKEKKKGQETNHTPRQTTRQERKPQEQHKPRLPRHSAPAVAEAIRLQPRLLNRVDHQHPERRADAGNPVDELDVNFGPVAGAVRECGRIDKKEESEGELLAIYDQSLVCCCAELRGR